jgi:XTP/dITP diphosphohydrolase
MNLCFATNNKHKLEEVRFAVGGNFSILSLADIGCHDELPETRETLEGNALQKAEYISHHFKIPCFADDSGLEVDALNGAPGVYSARYAGPQRSSDDNIDLLITNLSPHTNKKARFRTVIALLGFGKPQFFEGKVEGKIIGERKGSKGFGYDPVFVPDGHSKTFGEMSMEEKNLLSHRTIAVLKLIRFLKNNQG